MSGQATRLRVSLAQRELEVEGSEAFVREYAPRIEALLERLVGGAPATSPPAPLPEVGVEPAGLPVFGELAQRLPATCTDVDRMLLASWHVQMTSHDDAFATADANRRLTEQGIKIGNPSQCVKQALIAKRVFGVGKNRYRVSQQGRAHLRQLIGGQLPEPASPPAG